MKLSQTINHLCDHYGASRRHIGLLIAAFIVGPGLALTSVASTPQAELYRNLVTSYQDKLVKPSETTTKVTEISEAQTQQESEAPKNEEVVQAPPSVKPKTIDAEVELEFTIENTEPAIDDTDDTHLLQDGKVQAVALREPTPSALLSPESPESKSTLSDIIPKDLPPVQTPLEIASSEPASIQETQPQPVVDLSAKLPEPPASNKPWVAIIIDDIGYSKTRGLRAAKLNADITLAVIPHAPNSVHLAEQGHQFGKEIILHAPMSNLSGKNIEKGALKESMGRDEFLQTLKNNLDQVPHIVGVNNHMGSLLTQKTEHMSWLMGELHTRQLYFIDSRTSPKSQAYEIASNKQLPSLMRDVFLDNERSEVAIKKQFDQMIRIAKRRGWAIGIGHPYPETLAVLEKQTLNTTDQVEYVRVSQLLSKVRPVASQLLAKAETDK